MEVLIENLHYAENKYFLKLPAGNLASLDRKDLPDIECLGARTVREALDRVF
ncbi:MAG: hypothetical protein HGA24_12010 [Candidatus Aminicenantes bacterium]|nr:hypothetical protein [Candidatus Aminicenantes bacterium]